MTVHVSASSISVPAPAPAPVSRFPVPTLESLDDDLRAVILAVQEKAGFVPNVFLALAHRPAELRAFLAYHDALMEREGNLTVIEREMIALVISSANQCQYCVIAHGAILRVRARNPLISDQLIGNYRKADITPRQKAILTFALQVNAAAHEIGEADLEPLYALGLDQEDIWDISAITGLFGFSNRMGNILNLRANPEFYALGRG